jgi:hypothetical protein
MYRRLDPRGLSGVGRVATQPSCKSLWTEQGYFVRERAKREEKSIASVALLLLLLAGPHAKGINIDASPAECRRAGCDVPTKLQEFVDRARIFRQRASQERRKEYSVVPVRR